MSSPDDARRHAPSDPTRVTSQPALTTASGTSWVVVAALLAAASLFPLSALLIIDPGASFPLAVAVAVVIALLLITVIVLRLVIPAGRRRLRSMAWCTGALAAVALIGLFACLVIEWA